ncbi:MAG TPA: transglutaminase domain-containing protein [Candidatus Limnocylindria bacterium]|nr:transglutaminase domain-containing protein [Candidatus Limnocylindria bacterium]
MRLSATAASLFPRPDLSRLRFRGGLIALPVFVILNLIYPVSLQQADWVATTEHLSWLAILGIATGTLIGNGPMPARRGILLGGAVGALAVALLTIVADSAGPIRDRAILVAIHVNNWLTQVIAGEAASDPTVFVLTLGATVWAASFMGSFALAREHRIWDALIVNGICLVINVSLALTSLYADLIVFTLCALFLMTRVHIVALQERWQRQNIQPSGEMEWRVLRGGLTWTTVLVIMALVTPKVGASDALGSALTTFEAPYHAIETEWQRFFAGVSGPSRLRGVSFSDSIRLGQAPNLGDRVVMTVEVPNEVRPTFWRAITQDFYTGAGWKTTEAERVDRVVPAYSAREKVEILFDVEVSHANLLFAANEPTRANIPHQFTTGEDRNFSRSMIAVNRHQTVGQYVVTSYVSTADKATLRKAGTSYPAYVKQKYLQIPSTLPQRVRDKARQVAGNAQNPYDKAETIETWLRQTYRYSTVVKTPPAGRDPIDYFLFDLKEDFCEYFASAMIMMLRELGVPARYVQGYTTGTFDPETGRYVVREQNAHAWVEVFFPQYGWVEFEPTPSETVFFREDDIALGNGESPSGSGEDGDGRAVNDPDRDLIRDDEGAFPEDTGIFGVPGDLARLDPRPAIVALILVLIGMVAAFIRFQWRFRGLPPLEAAWGKTRLLGSYAGHLPAPSQTAYEYADSLARSFPGTAEPARTLAHVRVLDRYSPAGTTDDQREEAVTAWHRIARTLVALIPQRVLSAITRVFR